MSELARREYLKVMAEMDKQWLVNGLTWEDELVFAGRLDRIWVRLTDEEREAINQELEAQPLRRQG